MSSTFAEHNFIGAPCTCGHADFFHEEGPREHEHGPCEECACAAFTLKLTRAQRDALKVLKWAGKRVRASRRRSTLTPLPNVNMRAGGSLRQYGLARCIHPDFERGYRIDSGVRSGIVCEYEYEITPAGAALLAAAEVSHAL